MPLNKHGVMIILSSPSGAGKTLIGQPDNLFSLENHAVIESNISSANGEWSDENKLNTYSYLLEINASSPDITFSFPIVSINFSK